MNCLTNKRIDMKNLIGIILLGFLFLMSFGVNENNDAILNIQKQIYKRDLDLFTTNLNNINEILKQKSVNKESLRSALSETRLTYKRIEHFLEYFQGESIARYINGAPLPKIDDSAPGHNVIPPLGLQTLDEEIFADEINYEHVTYLAKELQEFWKSLSPFEHQRVLQHRYVFESLRFQLIRIYTLGLTGFDTPGSVNAIPEAIASLNTMQTYFEKYQNLDEEAEELAKKIGKLIKYLKANNDFDSLDRLEVLRNYFNPIYKKIYDVQKSLQIEMIDEVDPTQKAVNYHAQHIFDTEFLNKSYYSQIADADLFDPKKIQLGKTLFYDPILSKDLTLSCASCHHADKAFTDGLKKSKTNSPYQSTLRNAPTLINSVYAEKYFYDLREYDLERQVKHVVQDNKEFDMNFVDLADRLKESNEYVSMFKDAYGDRDRYVISSWSISNALAAYVTSLSSWNSEFDKYARGETDQIEESVIKGYNLFMGKAACGTCHFAPTFNGTVPPKYRESESEVLGVPEKPDTINAEVDLDPGRINSGRVRDELEHFAFSFKTTTVRNVELTAPYMHNGVYNTLEEVVDFYNRGGGAGIGIELEHQTLPDTPLNLNEDEKSDLVSFLHALSDTTNMTNTSVTLPHFDNVAYDQRSNNY